MNEIDYRWTDGYDKDFQLFYIKTEEYYSKIVGGTEKRSGFIPHNLSESISDVLIARLDDIPVGCTGLKPYSDRDVEIKRVWVEPNYRGRHIATEMMNIIENKAREMGFSRAILQTRSIMMDAVSLYKERGYELIENYPPYDKLDGAMCMALKL